MARFASMVLPQILGPVATGWIISGIKGSISAVAGYTAAFALIAATWLLAALFPGEKSGSARARHRVEIQLRPPRAQRMRSLHAPPLAASATSSFDRGPVGTRSALSPPKNTFIIATIVLSDAAREIRHRVRQAPELPVKCLMTARRRRALGDEYPRYATIYVHLKRKKSALLTISAD